MLSFWSQHLRVFVFLLSKNENAKTSPSAKRLIFQTAFYKKERWEPLEHLTKNSVFSSLFYFLSNASEKTERGRQQSLEEDRGAKHSQPRYRNLLTLQFK